MWLLPGNKKTFLDLFGKGRASFCNVTEVTQDIPIQFEDELILLWGREPNKGTLPDVIIVQSGKEREFLAWATAVIGGYRPFTAFFKVLDGVQAETCLKLHYPTLDNLENPFVGLIVGETLAQSINSRSISSLSVLACESTYSFSFARAVALGHLEFSSKGDPIADTWSLSRRLTHQPDRRLGNESLRIPLNVAAGLITKNIGIADASVPEFIRLACAELYSHGEVRSSWKILEDRLPNVHNLVEQMKGPRELRVQAFEQFLKQPKEVEKIISSFLVGLLANEIGPGTLDHLELIGTYAMQDPMALVWYGFCAGFCPDSDLQQVGACLGRRLVRDLLTPDPLLSRPKFDINIRELEVCLDREVPLEFRVASQSHIAVEIAPGVPAFMKWPLRVPSQSAEAVGPCHTSEEPSPMAPQIDLFSRDSWRDGQEVIGELERATRRLKTIWGALSLENSINPRGRGKSKRR